MKKGQSVIVHIQPGLLVIGKVDNVAINEVKLAPFTYIEHVRCGVTRVVDCKDPNEVIDQHWPASEITISKHAIAWWSPVGFDANLLSREAEAVRGK